MGFPFLFAICAAAMIGIAFVNIEKGREDSQRFVEARKLARVEVETGMTADGLFKATTNGNDGDGSPA